MSTCSVLYRVIFTKDDINNAEWCEFHSDNLVLFCMSCNCCGICYIAYSFLIKSYIVCSNNFTIVISRNLYMPKVETQSSRLNKCNIYMYMSYVNLLVNSALVYWYCCIKCFLEKVWNYKMYFDGDSWMCMLV